MRKQMKVAAVLSATALLALGASFTSMAAVNGTWVLEDEGWVCYDKDGDVYTDEFCLDGGKEYYVGEDGVMLADCWVEYEDNYYFLNEDGTKVLNDWRYTTPFEDEDAEEEYYYFGSTGKMQTGKRVIDGNTYYFGNEGQMLTGWVVYDADTKVADNTDSYSSSMVYCGEDGARLNGTWINTWAPDVDEDEQDANDPYWYYLKSTGLVQTGKATSIKGATYLFDAESKMLSGWVKGTDTNADGKYDSFATFEGDVAAIGDNDAIYFCGDKEDGHVQKDAWIKTWMPAVYEAEDDDNTKYWYFFGKTGELYVPDASVATSANAVTFVDGESRLFTLGGDLGASFKTVDGTEYAFRNDGRMWSGLVAIGEDQVRHYFGTSDDGQMATGSVMIKDEDGVAYKFFFGKNDKYDYTEGAAVTGAAEKYLYDNGLLVVAESDKYEYAEVGGEIYIINANGAIQTSKKVYKEDGEELIDAQAFEFYTESSDGTKKGAIK